MCSAVCSACLGRVGLLRVDTLREHTKLLESYEKLTNKKLIATGERAAALCFTCVSKLQRCRRLSDAAHKSNILRQGMSTKGVEVTHSDITALNLGTTQHLSVVALPHLTLTDNSNNESTPVTVKQEPTAVKEETMDDDLIDIGENTEDVAIYTSNNEGQCLIVETDSVNKDNNFYHAIITIEPSLKLHIMKRCPTCCKTFNCTSTLTVHMRNHTREKPFACKVCDKSFTLACNLKQHMIFHTGEKPHVCKICDKSYSLASDLKRHMLTHTGEKPFACKICDKAFNRSYSLKQHMIIHTRERPYVCNECHKTFKHASNLNQHMAIHTAEKHVCKICNKIFSISSYLKQHMLTHTREKHIPCKNCDKFFRCAANLKLHMQRFHT